MSQGLKFDVMKRCLEIEQIHGSALYESKNTYSFNQRYDIPPVSKNIVFRRKI